MTCIGAAGDHCTGTLTLTVRKKRKSSNVGSASFRVSVGATPKLAVRLTRRAVKTLRRRNLNVTAKAVSRNDAGVRKTTTARVTIKRKRH